MGQSLRIMSANLKNGSADPDAFANMVAALAVDVIALQELSHEQAAPLAELFDHGDIDPDHNYVGMGLLSRQPVAVERIPMTWGFGQTLRLMPSDWSQIAQPLEITNLHIAAPHMHSPAPGPYLRWKQAQQLDRYIAESDQRDLFTRKECAAQGPLAANSNKIQSSSASETIEGHGAPVAPGDSGPSALLPQADVRLRAKPPANGPARVLVGDFNATPYWPWYRRMQSQFTDAAVTVAIKTGEPLKPTWGPWPGSAKVLRIDHGFLRGVEVEGFEVLEVLGSDHCALVMDLTLPV